VIAMTCVILPAVLEEFARPEITAGGLRRLTYGLLCQSSRLGAPTPLQVGFAVEDFNWVSE
jgi:hypothetical protein